MIAATEYELAEFCFAKVTEANQYDLAEEFFAAVRNRRREASNAMYGRGLDGLTVKYTIMGKDPESGLIRPCDFYLKLAWYEGRLDYVDITPSGLQAHNIRMLIEVVCKEAYALLREEVWTTEKLIKEWIWDPFEPSGFCPQIKGIAKSPLDAAARIIEARQHTWSSL